MGIKDKIIEKRKHLEELKQRGIERSRQLEDERKRKKQRKFENMKPGARHAIVEGMILKKHPLDVMRDEYDRRKYEREKKYKR